MSYQGLISRRDFNLGVGSVAVGGLATLAGCGGGGKGNKNSGSSGNNFSIIVNDIPYVRAPYFDDLDTSSIEAEVMSFQNSETGFVSAVRKRSQWQSSETTAHLIDDLSGNAAVTLMPTVPGTNFQVPDTENFLPTIAKVYSNDGIDPSSFHFNVNLNERRHFATAEIKNPGGQVGNLIMTSYQNLMPAINESNVGRTPKGFFYAGDWSFDTIHRLNGVVNKGAAVFSFLDGGATYSVTRTLDQTLDQIENLWDWLDAYAKFRGTSLPFNKDTEVPVYLPISLFDSSPILSNGLVLLSSIQRSSNPIVDVARLYPVQPGNRWTYTGGGGLEVRVSNSYTRIRGKNLIALEESGITEYLGFDGKILKYYGFNEPSIGTILFDPAIPLGDNRVNVGSVYANSGPSKIISEMFGSRLDGTIVSRRTYDRRETVELNTFNPSNYFGECLRQKEDSTFSLRNTETGQTISDRIIGITHFAKGVGPVRIESSGRVYELSSFSKRFRPISSASGASANAYVPENLEGEISSVSSSVIRGIRGLGML